MDALKKRNEELREELARLEKLAQSVADEGKQETKKREVIENVKIAFDKIDKDHSGYIDKKELQALANDLGELLDEQELSAAFAAINVSGDGKISFNEFVRWWTTPDRQVSEKDFLKLWTLRSKLTAEYFREAIPKVVRQLSGLKLQEKENPHDWVNHRLALGFGEFSQPKASARLHVAFEKLDAKDVPGRNAILVRTVAKLNKDFPSDDLKVLQDEFEKKAKEGGATVEFSRDEKAGTWTMRLGALEADPLALAKELNLDLEKFVKEVSFHLDLANGIDAILGENISDKPLVEFVGLRTELKMQIRKALFTTIATTFPVPQAMELFWATFLEHANISFDFGDIKELVMASKPTAETEKMQEDFFAAGGLANNPMLAIMGNQPQGAAIAQMQNQMLFAFLTGFKKTVKMLTDQGAIAKLREMILQRGLPVYSKEAVDGFTRLRRVFSELSEVTVQTTSGVKLVCKFDNFLPVRLMPEPKLEDRAVVHHRGGAGHRGRKME